VTGCKNTTPQNPQQNSVGRYYATKKAHKCSGNFRIELANRSLENSFIKNTLGHFIFL